MNLGNFETLTQAIAADIITAVNTINTAVEVYLWGAFVRMRSSNVDLLRSFGLSLVGTLIHWVRFKESHNSLMQSEAEQSQPQFRSHMRMKESLKFCKASEREELLFFG